MHNPSSPPSKAIVLGSSRGIGQEIHRQLAQSRMDQVIQCSSQHLNTGDLASVRSFCDEHPECDVMVLNTGGPPDRLFDQITAGEWHEWFDRLFVGYVTMLQNCRVRPGGYVFHISSAKCREPDDHLIISTAIRSAFTALMKSLSVQWAPQAISAITIAPGPFDTDRLRSLVPDPVTHQNSLPRGHWGDPQEIGSFVRWVVDHHIRYLTGTTVYFDGATMRSLT